MTEGKVWGSKRSLVVWLVILMVVAVGLGVGLILVGINDRRNAEIEDAQEVLDNLTEDEENWSAEDYIKEIDDRISVASTDAEKAELYLTRAGELYNRQQSGEGDFAETILADAYAAEAVEPSIDTAYAIYVYEDEFGNSERAEEYLKLAEERGLQYSGGAG